MPTCDGKTSIIPSALTKI
uniref:Uncharacterized protein n=1 Tax=Rhizophora mucronata TaxID=61149 RepID=A0A2P2R1B6_RHIMU